MQCAVKGHRPTTPWTRTYRIRSTQVAELSFTPLVARGQEPAPMPQQSHDICKDPSWGQTWQGQAQEINVEGILCKRNKRRSLQQVGGEGRDCGNKCVCRSARNMAEESRCGYLQRAGPRLVATRKLTA